MSFLVIKPKYVLKHQIVLEAMHQLEGLSDGHVDALPHKRSWTIDIQLSGHVLDEFGMLLDFEVLDQLVSPLRGQSLNEKLIGETGKLVNPTTENVASFVYRGITRLLLAMNLHEDVLVDRVSVREASHTQVDLLREVISS